MRLILIIVTANRRIVLGETLRHLQRQTRLPDHLIVSAPDAGHVDEGVLTGCPVTYLYGASGCTAQRNRALDTKICRDADILVFFDDDFLPAEDYLANVVNSFESRSDWTVLTGHILGDGVKGPGFSFETGLRILAASAPGEFGRFETITRAGAYGCNMAFRANAIGSSRFDERLPLYGWQEDVDFSRRVACGKPVVRLLSLRGVHLGTKGGRVSGIRFGYSQIANPVYLVRKGTGTARWAANLMIRNVLANMVLSWRPERHVDRIGRLKGNMIAFRHLINGRLDPEHILQL